MRRAALVLVTAALLAGPTVLAFLAGGYFDGPRAAATGIAWALVLVLALAGPLPLPHSALGWVAAGGLAALALWSALSGAWAPVSEPVLDNVQRLLLYLGALLASLAVFRHREAVRAIEPALATGALIVIGYGLSGRLLPDLIEMSAPLRAGGRLMQPITYWNAEGLLAAMGLVLGARIAGDRSRTAWMRVAAASSCAPLAVGVYLSYSRGAIAAAIIGMLVLLAAAPSRPQLRACVAALASGVAASALAAAFPGVASLEGSGADQQRDGAIVLTILLLVMLAAALAGARAILKERQGKAANGSLPYGRRLPALAYAATLLCVIGLVVGGLSEDPGPERAEDGPSRLTSVQSARYEYWRVGVQEFGRDPLGGVGAGGFRVVWRMERKVDQGVNDVHSLVLEMVVELGLPGLLFFGLFVGGVAAAGRRAMRERAPIAAGACAVCTVWLLHAAIDWDFQLPAVTLPAIVLAGGLLAAASCPRSGRPASRQYDRRPQALNDLVVSADSEAESPAPARHPWRSASCRPRRIVPGS